MDALSLEQVAAAVDGRLLAGSGTVTGACIDSRRCQPGDLFVALPGTRSDGHRYLGAARAAGAIAALVARPVDDLLPQIQVAEPALALARLGDWVRRAVSARLVGLTGSNGKTSVKELLAAALGCHGPTLATEGNLNNHLGVPLTLCRLETRHRYGVVEMGANHRGEIGPLTELVRPQVGLVTNAGPAHLEGFGGLEGVALGKGELFQQLPADAVAVINADDRFAPLWREMAGPRRVLSFGLDPGADVRLEQAAGHDWLVSGGERLRLPQLPPGRHHRANAMAAAAALAALDLPAGTLAAVLAERPPVPGRLQQRRGRGGVRLLDDTYNANPASLAAALEVLGGEPPPRWLVLGDMGELGADGPALHRAAGRQALEQGVERLYACGPLAAEAAAAFGPGGHSFTDRERLIRALHEELVPGATVLVKGSRAAAMEQVVAALAAESGGEG